MLFWIDCFSPFTYSLEHRFVLPVVRFWYVCRPHRPVGNRGRRPGVRTPGPEPRAPVPLETHHPAARRRQPGWRRGRWGSPLAPSSSVMSEDQESGHRTARCLYCFWPAGEGKRNKPALTLSTHTVSEGLPFHALSDP